ncbi:MAG: endospore germination permease [Bacillota bacterium]|nr:endospore germination permease [Bacillota bacterium]MDP4169872.1 endospore germination permease [Bacillota bacterium]
MKKEKISSIQFGILVFMFSVGTSILITPALLAAGAKQGAWIPAIIGILGGLLLVLLFTMIGTQIGQMEFFEYCEKILGHWLGKGIIILYSFYAFITASILLWIQGNFMKIQIYKDTPVVFLQGIFALSILFAINKGIQHVSRSVEIFFPWVVMLLLFMFLALFPNYNTNNLLPVFDFKWKPALRSSLSLISVVSSPLVLLLTIFSHVTDKKSAKKSYFIGSLLGGIVLLIISLMTVAVLGAELTANQTYPTYIVAKKIRIGTFLTRIEVVLAIIWIFTIFYKTYLYFFAAIVGLAQVFNIKDYRTISTPLTFLLCVLSINIYPNAAFMSKWNIDTWIPFSLTFGLFFPVMLIVVGLIKKKRSEAGNIT